MAILSGVSNVHFEQVNVCWIVTVYLNYFRANDVFTAAAFHENKLD